MLWWPSPCDAHTADDLGCAYYHSLLLTGAETSWLNQEHFQQYLRQRASVIDPDEQDRSDRLDAAEAGDEEDSDDDNTGVLNSSAFVSPYAGVGPMMMPTPRDQVR